MDVEKLIEEGARAICVEMGNNPDADAGMVADEGCTMWECFTHESRAVVAIALEAAAKEEAALTNSDLLLAAGEMTASELRTVRAVLDWRAARLRTLAAQLGGKTDA